MLDVSGTGNTLTYYSRYNRIDKYEIYDHNTRLVVSGNTYIIGFNGKIQHSGLTYDFDTNNYYTYKAYFSDDSGVTFYLANQTILQSEYTEIPTFFVENNKQKNTFKTIK